MNFRKNLAGSQQGFQMAPMIDIMFLLLIFFMAAAIYAQWETRMDVTVPTAKSGERLTRQPGEIIINLDEQGDIYINEVKMDLDRLRSLLARVSEQYRDQPVIIRADRKTPHEHVMHVLDTCREVDIWNVAFAALPENRD
ncbi:MAG: biopolymer transporter ExbD [Candidatus Pacebacteria bacterium]|nr:biopolymer transporter ExbD [Candidatus Paceibacterota bacterium]